MVLRLFIYLLLSVTSFSAHAQLGGNSLYSFLDLPISARATAIGGAFYSAPRGDIALATGNPALLSEDIHKKISFNTGFYLAGTNFGTAAYGHHAEKLKTSFSAFASYTTYGKFDGRDAAGNPTGSFRAGNYLIGGGAARNWKDFTYGAQLKLIFSSIEQYNSFGMGLDLSAGYFNEDRNLVLTMLLRNIGGEFKSYVSDGDKGHLPLDLSFSLSKQFERLPIRLMLLAHHLQKWDLTRPKLTTNKNQQLIGGTTMTERGVMDKLFAHIVAGVEVEVGKVVRVRAGYDHLRRIELGGHEKKGLVGMSGGLGIVIQQFQIDYSFAKYHTKGSLNSIGIAVNLEEWGNRAN